MFSKILLYLFLISIMTANAFSFTFSNHYKIGDQIESEFIFNKKISYKLEPGVWTVVRKDGWFYGDIKVRMIGIAKFSGDEIVSIREFQEGNLSGSFQSELNHSLRKYFYLDKYDGCYERTEYTLVKVKSEGNFTNCFRVAHMDVRKEIFTPDDPEGVLWTKNYRKFIKDNNIKLPEIMLWSWHGFFSRTVSNNLYTVAYMDNPLYFEGPQHKFNTEDTSEYHPSNIARYPKFKKYMSDFIKISAIRHIDFESIVEAKDSHLLDFTDIGIQKKNYSNTSSTNKEKDILVKEKNDNIIKQITDLKKLLDEGVLTEEEFINAKKKILN